MKKIKQRVIHDFFEVDPLCASTTSHTPEPKDVDWDFPPRFS